jgi:hypothetical protein
MHPDRAHPAGVQDDDPIGVGDRRQPVGNDQDGSVDGDSIQGVSEDLLSEGIDLDVGSSRRMISGSVSIIRAQARRWR